MVLIGHLASTHLLLEMLYLNPGNDCVSNESNTVLGFGFLRKHILRVYRRNKNSFEL